MKGSVSQFDHISTAHMSAQFYADANGDWFMLNRGARYYLSNDEIAERARWEGRWGRRLRVRVRARSKTCATSPST